MPGMRLFRGDHRRTFVAPIIVVRALCPLEVSAIESLLVAEGVEQVIGWIGDEVDATTTQEDIDAKVVQKATRGTSMRFQNTSICTVASSFCGSRI